MNLIKPATLKEGDTIGILATSGAIEKESKPILIAVDYFEKMGFKETDIVKMFLFVGLLSNMIAIIFCVWM